MALSRFFVWTKALRMPFFTAVGVPVIVGATFAWYRAGVFDAGLFLLCLIGAVSLHAGANMVNDYFDHKSGNDECNRCLTPFSGGSRVIQDGLITPRAIFVASLICFAFGSAVGLYLNHIAPGNVILLIGLLGVAAGFFYCAAPLKIAYRGIGELAVGIAFGPLPVIGSYYVQTGTLNRDIVLISLPIGILILCLLYINEFPDYDADRAVGKNTLVVRLGRKRAAALFAALVVVIYVLIVWEGVAGILPPFSLVALLTLPLAAVMVRTALRHCSNYKKLLPANALMALLHLVVGILLSVGCVVQQILWKS